MRRFAAFLLVLLLPITCVAQHEVKTIVDPTEGALKKNWVFVVDTSDSMVGVFGRAMAGIEKLTSHGSDEWYFKLIVFNDGGMTQRTKWYEGSPDAIAAAEKWVNNPKRHGVSSYGRSAIREALRDTRKELSVFLITDGGFTSACNNQGFSSVRATIKAGQAWRVANSLPEASITTVGISNSHYSDFCDKCRRGARSRSDHNYLLPDYWKWNKGRKPSDSDCQAFLQEIGTDYEGGYILVRGAIQGQRSPKSPDAKEQPKRPVVTNTTNAIAQ